MSFLCSAVRVLTSRVPERFDRGPSATLVEPPREIGTNPCLRDAVLGRPPFQVLHKRSADAGPAVVSTDNHAGHPGTGLTPLVQVVMVQPHRAENFLGGTVGDEGDRQAVAPSF